MNSPDINQEDLQTQPVTSTLEVAPRETSLSEVIPTLEDQQKVIVDFFSRRSLATASPAGLAAIASAVVLETILQNQQYGESLFEDVVAFHQKFGLTYEGPTRDLEDGLKNFRIDTMYEEVQEYIDATSKEEQLDALVDLIYFALGTAYLHGFSKFDEAWMRVHAANMKKVRAQKPSDSKRGTTFDVVKPKGWMPPNLSDLV